MIGYRSPIYTGYIYLVRPRSDAEVDRLLPISDAEAHSILNTSIGYVENQMKKSIIIRDNLDYREEQTAYTYSSDLADTSALYIHV